MMKLGLEAITKTMKPVRRRKMMMRKVKRKKMKRRK